MASATSTNITGITAVGSAASKALTPSARFLTVCRNCLGPSNRTGVDLRRGERCRQPRRARADRDDNPGGAKVFQPELAEHFKGRQTAYILEDNDDAGREHTRKILAVLTGAVPNIAVVQFPELPEKGDVSDWLEAGETKSCSWRAPRKRSSTTPHRKQSSRSICGVSLTRLRCRPVCCRA